MLTDLQWRAVGAGAAVAGLAGLVATLGIAALDPADDSPLLLLATFLALASFFGGGMIAARRALDRPATHAALAAAAGYLVVQGAGVVRRLIVGDDLSWLSYLYLGLLATTTGLIGGYVAALLARRSAAGGSRRR